MVLSDISRLSLTRSSEDGQLLCDFSAAFYFLFPTHQMNDLVQKGLSSKNLK
jgi:hypothetical protein